VSTAALLLAGGRGERLRAGVPKAFCLLDGVPLLVHGLRALAGANVDLLVAVVPEGHEPETERALSRWLPETKALIVSGAPTRHGSLHRGMSAIAADLVIVHDVSRPLAGPDLAVAVLRAVRDGADLALPVTEVVETVKIVDPSGEVRETVPRETLRRVQTPQAVRWEAYASAHAGCADLDTELTNPADPPLAGDTAAIAYLDGHDDAFPVVRPQDLALAEAILALPRP
jgi:2-C-methyl-D-erythritol 4-phosphate cytidylyltransferase